MWPIAESMFTAEGNPQNQPTACKNIDDNSVFVGELLKKVIDPQ